MPAAGFGTRNEVRMRSEVRKGSCTNCGRPNNTVPTLARKVKCELCGDDTSIQQESPMVGEVLRRWTIDSLSSGGLRAHAELEDELVGDVRRFNLLASRLMSVKSANDEVARCQPL